MHRFTDLGREWNVRGLGRLTMVRLEVERLAAMGFRHIPKRYVTDTRTNWDKVPIRLRNQPTRLRLGGMYPVYVPNAADAKLLHWNGEAKPWRNQVRTTHHAKCILPKS